MVLVVTWEHLCKKKVMRMRIMQTFQSAKTSCDLAGRENILHLKKQKFVKIRNKNLGTNLIKIKGISRFHMI